MPEPLPRGRNRLWTQFQFVRTGNESTIPLIAVISEPSGDSTCLEITIRLVAVISEPSGDSTCLEITIRLVAVISEPSGDSTCLEITLAHRAPAEEVDDREQDQRADEGRE